MSDRVPQTDPWKAPKDDRRSRRVFIVAIVVGVAVLLAVALGALLIGEDDSDDTSATRTTSAQVHVSASGPDRPLRNTG